MIIIQDYSVPFYDRSIIEQYVNDSFQLLLDFIMGPGFRGMRAKRVRMERNRCGVAKCDDKEDEAGGEEMGDTKVQ